MRTSVLLLCCLVILSESKDATNQCGKAAKTSTYLETAVDMLDKIKENLPKVDCSCPSKPMDCEEIFKCGNNQSTIYEIFPRNRILNGGIRAFCDMETDGGGWTVIQRRGDFKRPADFFFKTWQEYKSGFGDLRRDFWLGNDIIYAITNQKKYYLRFDLTDFENNTRYAFYDQFWIDSENQGYKLHAHDYSGDAGDSFAKPHSGYKFSTMDRDNDNSSANCAEKHKGAWWYAACHASNLNGLYLAGKQTGFADGVLWTTWKGVHESLMKTEMKIRPIEFRTSLLDLEVDPK